VQNQNKIDVSLYICS